MKRQFSKRKKLATILLLSALPAMGLIGFSAEASDGVHQVMKHNLLKRVDGLVDATMDIFDK